MNYRTQLMQQILTNEKAQEIIDYVSQIYGDSYVGLWFYQTIGSILGPICDISDQLRYETSPYTTDLLLAYYEREYGIQEDPTMTLEQRRARVVAARRSKGACTPARLADAVSAVLGGVPVEIIEYNGSTIELTEIDGLVLDGQGAGPKAAGATSITTDDINQMIAGQTTWQEPDAETSVSASEVEDVVVYNTEVSKGTNLESNEFIVNIRSSVKSTAPAKAVIDRMKPAHLIYTIRGVVQESAETDITIGTAVTTAELFKVEVNQ